MLAGMVLASVVVGWRQVAHFSFVAAAAPG
jgi:hypothetical protein